MVWSHLNNVPSTLTLTKVPPFLIRPDFSKKWLEFHSKWGTSVELFVGPQDFCVIPWHFENGASINIDDVLPEYGGLLHVLALALHLNFYFNWQVAFLYDSGHILILIFESGRKCQKGSPPPRVGKFPNFFSFFSEPFPIKFWHHGAEYSLSLCSRKL